MTAPSYTEDLSDIATGDESSGWSEFTGNSYNTQGAPAYQDNEYPYIQGSYAVTQDTTKTGIGSLGYNAGGITVPTDGAVFVWHNYSSPFVLGTYAQGGFRIVLGSGLGDFYAWYVGGQDKDSYPYGGFVNHVVNPTVSADDTAGSPTGTINYVGSAVNVLSGPSKGEPHQVDAMRYGRGSAIFEHGDLSNGYCTIAGFAALNDAQTARWGLIQATSGGYLWKGRLQLGSASNPVDFRDSNKTIFIQWTPKVTINFNTIEVINASSNVEMTGFTFQCLDTSTASRGRWITTNDAVVELDSCTFIDMYTFVFDSNTNIQECAFRRCNQVTQGGCTIDGTLFSNSPASPALLVDDLDLITNCDFVSTGTGYAIELTTPGTYDLVGCSFTNYGADGTANACIYNNSGGAVTINVSGGDTPTYTDGSGASTTIVAGAVTVKVTVTDAGGTAINGARVLLKAANATGPFPYQESVTISNSGTTATVTHTGHGLATNDKVEIKGSAYAQNEGVHQITVSDVNTYTYTMSSAPGDGSVSGTITSTFVALSGLTSSGIVSTSRVYSSNQPVTGWARKSSGSPFYKTGPLSGSVDSSGGYNNTAVLILDE